MSVRARETFDNPSANIIKFPLSWFGRKDLQNFVLVKNDAFGTNQKMKCILHVKQGRCFITNSWCCLNAQALKSFAVLTLSDTDTI